MQKGLVDKPAIAGFINNADLNKKIGTLTTKAELKTEQDKITKLQGFDSRYFSSKSLFEDDETQNCLVFQPMHRYLKKSGDTDQFSAWKSKGLSDESINHPTTSNNSLAPSLNPLDVRTRVKSDGICLKEDEVTFTHGNLVNIYIVCETNLLPFRRGDFTLGNPSFGSIRLVKNTDKSKCKYIQNMK